MDNEIKPGQYLFNITHRAPFAFVAGMGSTLITEDGKRMLDFWNDEGVASLGYNTPEVQRPAMELLTAKVPHRLPRAYHGPNREYNAALLVNRMGYVDEGEHGKVFYANSGAEANETAIKLARRWQWFHGSRDKMGVVTVKGNFHGRTAFAMACSDATDSPYHKEGYGPMPPLFGTVDLELDPEAPHGIRVTLMQGDRLPPGDDPNLTIEQVGALNMAPVLGNNVVTTYPRELFQALRRWADANGVLIIFDDVQAGAGRCGYYSSWQHPDIDMRPDILCLGKGIAMGYPMSVVIAMESIAKAITPGSHFNSMAGSEWVCHFSTRFIQWLDEHMGEVRVKGDMVAAELSKRPWIKQVTGYGLMRAFDIDWGQVPYNGRQFCDACHAQGLLLMTWRDFGVIRFNPPMNVSVRDLAAAFQMMDNAHKELMAALSPSDKGVSKDG